MTQRIAFQGELGAYSHEAVLKARPDATPVPCTAFEDAIEAVNSGKADLAMLPVENTTYGRVADIHRLLPESGLHIIDEAFVRVRISLMAMPGQTLDDISLVRAHLVLIPQARAFLDKHNIAAKPAADSAEMKYLHARREALGGYMPQRRQTTDKARRLTVPNADKYARFARAANGKEMSTTMAFVRMLGSLLKDKTFGPSIVPIVADEARTFGMDNLFRQIGIYAPDGQLYEPEDAGSMMFYKEAKDGQLLEEGITEAGALSSWAAAARPIRYTTRRWCPSTSTIRCSAFSGSGT